MSSQLVFNPTSLGIRLDTRSEAFGALRDSTAARDDVPELRQRMAEDGYLLLRGLLDSTTVEAARTQITTSLVERGLVLADAGHIAAPGARVSPSGFEAENRRFSEIRQLAHSGNIVQFFQRFFAAEVRSFDFVWMRLMAPGQGTPPHCDFVYMGRGTEELYTTWMPLTPVGEEDAPLMMLEGSHRVRRLRDGYCRMDIDRDGNARKLRFRHWQFFRGGDYSHHPKRVQKEFGLRWLTAKFAPGDVVIFTPFTLHGSLDNRSNRFRIAIDARYQRAGDLLDERWIGENPIGHSRGY